MTLALYGFIYFAIYSWAIFVTLDVIEFSISRLLESGSSGGRGRDNRLVDVAEIVIEQSFRDYPNFTVPDYTSSQFLRELGRPASNLMRVFEDWMYNCSR